MGNIEYHKESGDDIVVDELECLGPIGHKIDNSFWRVTLVSVTHNEVNENDEGMSTGVTREGKLIRGKVLRYIGEETLDTAGTTENNCFKGLAGPFSEAKWSDVIKISRWKRFGQWGYIFKFK